MFRVERLMTSNKSHNANVEHQFAHHEQRSATVARISTQPPPHHHRHHHESQQRQYQNKQPLQRENSRSNHHSHWQTAKQQTYDRFHRFSTAIYQTILRFRFSTGIRQHTNHIRTYPLAESIAAKHHPRQHLDRHISHQTEHQQKIKHKSQHSISADVRILHNLKRALTVCASAHSVAEIGESVFVKSTSQHHTHHQCQRNAHISRKHHRRQPERQAHHTARQPSSQRPQRHHALIVATRHIGQTPKRQARKERQRR